MVIIELAKYKCGKFVDSDFSFQLKKCKGY